MTYERIPAELRALKQWVLWDKDKVPHQVNGKKADVTDPNTWTTFDACCCVDGFNGIGFVFSSDDVYTGIDLDAGGDAAAQLAIFNAMDSYSEISPSGKGLHIIVKGTVPSGARKEKIEVYSSGRYFTMTGNVYPFNSEKSIRECQSELIQLWEQLQPRKAMQDVDLQVYNSPQTESDEKIIERCRKADNGEWFSRLYAGDFSPDNNGRLNIQIEKHRVDGIRDESRDDLALFNFIVFHTHNLDQIERIFHSSALGKRKKAYHRGYLDRTIKRAFDQTPPPVDISGFKEALDATLNKVNGHKFDVVPTTNSTIDIPPGLIGDIARFIYAAAPKPVPEIALAGALGLMAGICGRAYNVSATGLNQYILLLAPTGTGKEAMSSGISRLMSAVKRSVPDAREFIGPSELASGQALVRYMDKTSKCFVSLFDEFDRRLRIMSDVKSHSTQIVLQQKLLEVYQKSGRGQDWQPSVFADSEKNTKVIDCPALTILGYCTPEKLYSELTEEMIIDGMLPRFSLIEYNGTRPETNYHASFVQPSKELENQVADLCAHCLKMMHSIPQQWIDVQFNTESWNLACAFDKYCDNQVNSTSKEVLRRLWTRAYLKVLKLAGLIAVGCNYLVPTISVEHIQYAIDMVNRDIMLLTAKFESGETGKNTLEIRQMQDMIRTIREFLTEDWEKIKAYSIESSRELHKMKLIPKDYLNARTSRLASFKNDPRGASFALTRTIKMLIDDGKLIDYTRHENYKLLKTTKQVYFATADCL